MTVFLTTFRTVFGMIRRDSILLAPSLVLVSLGFVFEFFKLSLSGDGIPVVPGVFWWIFEFVGLSLILQNLVFVLSLLAGLDVFHETEIELSSLLKRLRRPFLRMVFFVICIMVVVGPFVFPGSEAQGLLGSVLGNDVGMGVFVAGSFFVVLFLMFVPFAIVVDGVSVKQAVLTSVRFVRHYFREVVSFVFFEILFVAVFLIVAFSMMGVIQSVSDLGMIKTAWFVLVTGTLQAVIWYLNLVFFVTCRASSGLASR